MRACGLAALLVVLALAAGCATAPKPGDRAAGSPDLIVLLPDERGKTGAIVVSGEGGERLLNEPRQAVSVAAGGPPSEPFVMSGKQVQTQVGQALAALPPPPIQFILFFLNDTTELTPESRDMLRQVARTIRERRSTDISVVGHTDTVGTKAYNHRLSLRRSDAVAALLTHDGVDRSLLEISSHGEDNPLVRTGDEVPEPRNRRVEITVR